METIVDRESEKFCKCGKIMAVEKKSETRYCICFQGKCSCGVVKSIVYGKTNNKSVDKGSCFV